jgi:hypothetical protein
VWNHPHACPSLEAPEVEQYNLATVI